MLRRSDAPPKLVRQLESEKGVEEIFDGQILPSIRIKGAVEFQKESIYSWTVCSFSGRTRLVIDDKPE